MQATSVSEAGAVSDVAAVCLRSAARLLLNLDAVFGCFKHVQGSKLPCHLAALAMNREGVGCPGLVTFFQLQLQQLLKAASR